MAFLEQVITEADMELFRTKIGLTRAHKTVGNQAGSLCDTYLKAIQLPHNEEHQRSEYIPLPVSGWNSMAHQISNCEIVNGVHGPVIKSIRHTLESIGLLPQLCDVFRGVLGVDNPAMRFDIDRVRHSVSDNPKKKETVINNSIVHVDLRTDKSVDGVAMITNLGPDKRFLVAMDLKKFDELAKDHQHKLCQLWKYTSSNKHGFYKFPTGEEYDLIRPALVCHEIPKGHTMILPQDVPHGNTKSKGDSVSVYNALQFGPEDHLKKIADHRASYLINGQPYDYMHIRQPAMYGKVNDYQSLVMQGWLMDKRPPVSGEKRCAGGYAAKHNFPSTKTIIENIKCARIATANGNPTEFQTMVYNQSKHLTDDDLKLPTRAEINKIVPVELIDPSDLV